MRRPRSPITDTDGVALEVHCGIDLECSDELFGHCNAVAKSAESSGARLKLQVTVQVRITIIGGNLEKITGTQLSRIGET
ncbi:hypothetical protein [Mycobacterium leprae]|uniref:hypothetical protein n=1 Tax=Mycobacterium leprae TaxID=1769 RepID=UPI000673DA4A|nr:hypothetical protein [Mycobacterium leprae]OAR20439.1 hypothetical protein A8144_10770 [Mycobacterium leprae 3125609]OAX70730.1 hypothetical protein A3216_10235 [Mycobacterium leprae 7935681]